MSAILSADDLNDFISPGVACIKPVETLPKEDDANPYEVTTEDKVQVQNPAPASISLTDCLACSGCVTSAEAVLVSLQSHSEVLNTLDSYPSLNLSQIQDLGNGTRTSDIPANAKLFVASVSPQVRASLAATFGITESQAGHMVQQFLSGPQGLRTGGEYNSDFAYVVDTNCMRDVCLVLSADEVEASLSDRTKPRPVLTSACPGWVCYAEKTHPHVLPHLSALKSPQALTGTLLKSVLSKKLGINPSQIWHLAIMPCFDKKLEASREELTDKWWSEEAGSSLVRDVDCVITSRELLTLAEGRDVQLDALPLIPIPDPQRIAFPDLRISSFLFPPISSARSTQSVESGTSGGYLSHILQTYQSQHPGSIITTQKGRNSDVVEYTLQSSANQSILKCARYYGFRNIQNLVRKLKPARQSKLPGAAARRTAASGGNEYAYVEVMACPGGCTNGGGQIKLEDVASIIPQTRGEEINPSQINTSLGQKEWLARVDEAYFSASSDSDSETNEPLHDTARTPPPASSLHLNGTNGIQKDTEAAQVPANDAMEVDDPLEVDHKIQINNISPAKIHQFLEYWSASTGVELDKLAYTTFRKVESDVGKKSTAKKMGDSERIAAIAGLQGGGW